MDLFASQQAVPYKVMAGLRDVLAGVVLALEKSGQEVDRLREFDAMLRVAHYMALQQVAHNNETLRDLEAKLAVSLVRYTEYIPADKAFYLAGMACNV